MTELPPTATTAAERAGILVAVVSGGRPELRDRPTARFLPALVDAGVSDVIWSVRDDEADKYESDGHRILTYPTGWARDYAEAHWTSPEVPVANGWYGGIAGREAACQEADRRGCWATLFLDDNIDWLCFLRGTEWSKRHVMAQGGMALFLDLLAGITLATNGRLVGAQLDAVSPSSKQAAIIARPGFPYSLYVERMGSGREDYFGPYEEDIFHALQYGTRADGATALIMPGLHYKKNTVSMKGGNRKQYGPVVQRAVPLQRLYPQAAKVGVRATHSNGRGEPRIFHTMRASSIRNPMVIRDPARFALVRGRMQAMAGDWYAGELEANRDKVRRRTLQGQRMGSPTRAG